MKFWGSNQIFGLQISFYKLLFKILDSVPTLLGKSGNSGNFQFIDLVCSLSFKISQEIFVLDPEWDLVNPVLIFVQKN